MIKPVSLITGSMILVAMTVLLFHLSTDYSEYSMHNPGWNGTSQFFGEHPVDKAVILTDTAELPQYSDAVLVIIAPNKNFTSTETDHYKDFLVRGNTIVLFDDFGTGNELLEKIGTTIRIRQTPLLSADRTFEDPVFVKSYPINTSKMTLNMSSLTMDRPSALDGGHPFLVTSPLSWEERNGNTMADQNETLERFAVGSFDQVGEGRIVVVSDPGILINSMVGSETGQDQARFIDTMLHLNRTIIMDQTNSMTADTTPQSRIIYMIQTTSPARIGILTLLLLLVFFGLRKQFR